MGLIDHTRGRPVKPIFRGWVRLGPLADDEEEELAILADEDDAIAEASRPSIADDLADLASRLLPVHRPHRKWRR